MPRCKLGLFIKFALNQGEAKGFMYGTELAPNSIDDRDKVLNAVNHNWGGVIMGAWLTEVLAITAVVLVAGTLCVLPKLFQAPGELDVGGDNA
ncbi:hypothetical protein [Hahella ganghwensis]|uniref:hypothetical protein n=1 Tax=Hahella ganghwensis TaxID=286420 RepID=UPI0012F84BFF|nr:hypothetical protein [Hahella ganghwensis]